MTPFQKLPPDPMRAAVRRQSLLSQPDEAFRDYFGGMLPTLQQKLHVVEIIVQEQTTFDTYQNDTYLVDRKRKGDFWHLAIARHDGAPARSWSDFQQIKNELVGPHHEAIEIFPAEERLVDTANQYHLWVYANPTHRIPVGFNWRSVAPGQPGSVDGGLSASATRPANTIPLSAPAGAVQMACA